MSRQFPELDQARVVVSSEVRERHQAAIARALYLGQYPRIRRIRLLAVGLAVLLVIPVMALASDRAVPGDFLYPVKRAFEPVFVLFDTDVVEQHRVEEVEDLFDRQVAVELIRDHITVARSAVPLQDTRLSSRVDIIEFELDQIHSVDGAETTDQASATERPKVTTRPDEPPFSETTTTRPAEGSDRGSGTGTTTVDDKAPRGRDGG